MNKHIQENGHWYLLILIFIAIFSYSKINNFIESYDPPIGIVVNMKGEITKQKDKEKELKQGIKFWQHQLVAVREAINEPEEVIALSHRLNKIQHDTNVIKKSTEIAVDQMLHEKGLMTPDLKDRIAIRKEIEIKEKQLDNLETSKQLQIRYDAAVKRQPDLLELEQIIALKINNFKN
jgi:hypothetical protein